MSEHAAKFDASHYLTKVNGRDYLEVKWRLLWLRTEHPEAIVQTELAEHREGYALFKARVAVPEGGEASGWGSESADDFGEYLEKAETKALGRALAALGYGTQFCEDFDYRTENEQRFVDAPVERPASRTGRRPAREKGTELSTPAQGNALRAIARQVLGWDEATLEARTQEEFGRPTAQLTKAEASRLIDELKQRAPER